ncbi:MAG: ABC transporter permease [Dysgonamonadaceae bacterium]|jgi:hypothetical protein|nr:ABC transporter permease [Dysgonamonadaceae bacterium]
MIQLAAYALASLTGITVLFAGFCFSRDIRPLFGSRHEGLFRKELFIVNKPVKTGILGKSNTTFTGDEISEIKRQPFVRSAAGFLQSHFEVYAWVNFGGNQTDFGTEMFFESVPDAYIDCRSESWHWSADSMLIPLIIPRDYLNLYNFGFAGTQGLPQVSERLIRELTFNVRLTGNGLREIFVGRIVDFSDDINTILVPESFLRWANGRFGGGDEGKVTRLIIEIGNPADTKITEFFSSKPDYIIGRNKGESGRLSFFLNLLITAIIVVGVLILLPSICLMLLSINLLVYKNEKTLYNLLLLGYGRVSLLLPYCIMVLALNFSVGALGLWLVRVIRGIYIPRLEMLGIGSFSDSLLFTSFFAVLCMIAISLFDIFWIKRKVWKVLDLSRVSGK